METYRIVRLFEFGIASYFYAREMSRVQSLGLVWLRTYQRGIDDARNVASIIK
jgi:hypothetical protein